MEKKDNVCLPVFKKKEMMRFQRKTGQSDLRENFNIVCMESFGSSKPKEVWVKCGGG